MKPVYTGQRTVSGTDKKFRPTDEHLLEKNKEELDEAKNGANIEPLSHHHRDNSTKSTKGDKSR